MISPSLSCEAALNDSRLGLDRRPPSNTKTHPASSSVPGILIKSDSFGNQLNQQPAISPTSIEPDANTPSKSVPLHGQSSSSDSMHASLRRLRNKLSALNLRKLVFQADNEVGNVSDSDFEVGPDPDSEDEKSFEDFMDIQEFERDWNTVRDQDLEERILLLKEQVAEDRPRNPSGEVLLWDATTIGKTLIKEQDANEECRLLLQHKEPRNLNYSLVSAHVPAFVPYPMSYDPVTMRRLVHNLLLYKFHDLILISQ